MITVTDKAARKVGQLLTREGKPGGALRLKVISGGCSGFQYKLDLAEAPASGDAVIESAGVRVVVDPTSALYLMNSQVDYVESLKFSGFKIHNPNAVAECSCGQSFSA
jgi:iron-sulfur cluster assembly protein